MKMTKRESFHFGHSRNASELIKLGAYQRFFFLLRCGFFVSACMIVDERIGRFLERTMEDRIFHFHFIFSLNDTL